MNVIEVNDVSKMFRLGQSTGDLREVFSGLFAKKRLEQAEKKAAQEFWALRDISFSVAEGESFGIIGHNGSGKSTLLKLITGIYKPTKGAFKTRGRISALIEVGAGFHPDLTGRENVYLNGSVLGMKRREIDKRFDEIVAFSEIEKFIDTPVKRYSSGMFMRLGFAVAAHVDPDIVLVDEVLAVGDEAFQKKCMNRMLELRSEGKTIVFISHAMGAVEELCQRVMLLSHGHMIDVGNPRDVISTYRSMLAVERNKREQSSETIASIIAPTRDIKILDVRLLDAEGRPCDIITAGETVTLECRYRAEKRVESPVLGMSLLRTDGLFIYGFNTSYDSIPVAPIEKGEGSYRVSFPALDLLTGDYYFNVDISLPDNDIPGIFPLVDARDKAATLQVTADTLNLGVVHLPHVWEVDSPYGMSTDVTARSAMKADALAFS